MSGYSGPTGIFIGNKFVESVSGKKFATVQPSTGQVITHVSEGDQSDIDLAVSAAEKAFVKWKKFPGNVRAAYLFKIADLIEQNIENLAQIETLDNGMSINVSRGAIGGAALWLRYFAGFADKITGLTVPLPNPTQMCYTIHEPFGVVGAIIPWNFPFTLAIWKIAPALATGNTMVIKPSEKTPLSILALCELVVKAGLPAGVLNVVPGYGPTAGEALSRHPRVRKITFTGSLNSGRLILKASAETNLKRVTLELGGKSPVIVCQDADIDEAAFFAYNGIFIHQGQFCAAGSRVFVHESIYDKFVQRAVELAKGRSENIGEPENESNEVGPIVDHIQFKRVNEYIKRGVSEGAKLAFGGEIVNRPGYFIQPTVFTDVKDDMTIAKEEIFGPVQSILKFSTLKEAISRANNTEYGLAAAVFTKDLGIAHTVAAELEAGIVWINCYAALYPQTAFGGFKQSGIGRENGEAVLKEYLNLKTVVVQLSQL